MFRKIKGKRSFLLSEFLVACVLISLLLGSLGYWTRRIWVSHKEKAHIYRTFLHDGKMYRLLRDIFLSTTSIEEGQELVFSFDRGVYVDPDLAGLVQGKLLYDPNDQELSLVISSERMEGRQETFPLWKQVLSVEWRVLRQQELGRRTDRVYLTLVRKSGALPPRTLSYVFAVGG
ncbi:DUF1494 domain-containing protein [Chlamydia muridarum str. Nigg]|jgi:Protein of unknown function (DUF1494).|uniref:Uncharacterized protein n=2 Tax=Chlamydia muridarum TaxID=83560 RepID=A0A070A232_CHLMR|nr:DUF1494 domain-containing protein [Chlamydia muridarum]UFT54348.1 DUF1494 domain-containing protein [Chlamydia trachomatis]AAF39652.1 conserved hypothetical protein [Chlamydia muridarum str. Nigg]AHH23242.1 hypothetical protein TAC_04535 [Chlamydia muridarum str. Nigg3 CMUT3-5]AHH24168.1 hypothetical protein Y015_04535 [Chlamydia muridarum str. Nigg CM972]AID38368.1 hypothetical protein BB17_04590 [Chlamydia muridarum str. Nigg 2 MCR]